MSIDLAKGHKRRNVPLENDFKKDFRAKTAKRIFLILFLGALCAFARGLVYPIFSSSRRA